MDRRTFLVVLGSAAAALANEKTSAVPATATGDAATEFDAGPLAAFEQEKVYDQFRDQGVFLVRRGDEVFAFSPICTHKGCKVRVQEDQSFLCKCHGSRFDPAGKVLNGPATQDLLRLQVKLSADQRVLVRVRKPKLSA